MKIGFVLEHFYPHIGGGETMFKEYTARLVEMGCEVKVATSNSGGITGGAVYDGVDVHHYPWRGLFGHPIPDLKDLYELAGWADVIHGAIFPAALAARQVARKFNKPCMVTVYEVWGKKWFWVEKNYLKASLFYAFEQYVLRRGYPLCHAISHATARDLREYGKREQPVVTIYPGLKNRILEAVLPEPSASRQQKTFLYYGRPGKSKGLFVLLEAIRAIDALLPEEVRFAFILANDPVKEKQRFIQLVARYHLAHRVQISDSLPEAELMAAIRAAYCIIVPSITEGFGYTAAEACSLGCPIIASDGGSLPEVVSGDVLLFKNRDPQALAEKILLAAAGKFDFIPRKIFNWGESTQRLFGSYEELLRRHNGADAQVLAGTASV